MTAAFEAAWADPEARAAMMKQFGTAEYFTKADMAWMFADSAAMGPQCVSGRRGVVALLLDLT